MAGKQLRIKELEKISGGKDFWVNTQQAARVSRELSDLKKQRHFWDETQSTIAYLLELVSVADSDESLRADVEKQVGELDKKLDAVEFELFLSGPYDSAGAYLTVWSGAGGVDAQDWAEMLLRMYQRYCERKGFEVKMLDEHKGEEGGIKRATIEVNGRCAYGYLRGENGVHRLVRISPFSAQKLRHTSFAMVETLPQIPEVAEEIEIKPEDIEMEAFRSSGPGGQNVNKVSTAVRIRHIPTGLVIAVQSGRSQSANRAKALEILKAKLYIEKVQAREREIKQIRGEHKKAEWGSQIRSYVLHPYQMVKDHRSGFQTADIGGVLDGNLQEIIESEIRTRDIASASSQH